MSDDSVIPDEMRWQSDISDEAAERLLSGNASGSDAETAEVARFFEDVRRAYSATLTPECEEGHIAAISQAARVLAEQGDPVVRPASKAHGPETQASGLPKLRRLEMLKALMASTKFKVAAGALALLLLSGGTAFAASQGGLPHPVQNAVAGAAAVVGIDVPTADEADDVQGDQSAIEAEPTDSTDDAVSSDVSADDQTGATEADDQNEQDQADEADSQDAQGDQDQADEADSNDGDHQDAQSDDDQEEHSTVTRKRTSDSHDSASSSDSEDSHSSSASSDSEDSSDGGSHDADSEDSGDSGD